MRKFQSGGNGTAICLKNEVRNSLHRNRVLVKFNRKNSSASRNSANRRLTLSEQAGRGISAQGIVWAVVGLPFIVFFNYGSFTLSIVSSPC